MARKKRNRSQDIRDYMAIDPAAGPAKIVAELKKQGIVVSSALVSRVRSRENSKGQSARPKRGRPPLKRHGRPTNGELVAIDSLIQARAFADKVGGIEEASRLLQALARVS